MSQNRNNKQGIAYNIDLTLTDDCNFKCSYCFEKGYFNKNYFNKYDLLFTKINELLESPFFLNKYDLLSIGFWGGEPTLHEDAIKKIVEYYSNNDKVKFFIYSNGSNIDPYMDILEKHSTKIVYGHPKLCIQISYDGMPVQDICRKTIENKITSTLVKNAILKLYSKQIPTTIKATITLETLKYLPQTRRDILSLIETTNGKNFFRSSNYFPTIDYYHIDHYTTEEIEQYYKDFHKSLLEISREEIQYFKKNKRFFFSWFTPNKALCCAGRDMVCINWDGNIFKCHGSLYKDISGDHYITSLNNDFFISELEKSYELHNSNFRDEPELCKTCVSTFCLRCNPVKFAQSKKEIYIEKWRDYTDQPRLCKFYKLNGKIVRATNELLKNMEE